MTHHKSKIYHRVRNPNYETGYDHLFPDLDRELGSWQHEPNTLKHGLDLHYAPSASDLTFHSVAHALWRPMGDNDA